MIDIKEHPSGSLLPVRAQPNAKKVAILGEQAGALKVSVTAVPEQGKANKALVLALVKLLGFKKSQIELVSGETSREKRFLFHDVSARELAERVQETLETN